MSDQPYMARGSLRGFWTLELLTARARLADRLEAQVEALTADRNECLRKAGENGRFYMEALAEVEALRGELEFWKQAAETQKDNNMKLLDEIRSLKTRKEEIDG